MTHTENITEVVHLQHISDLISTVSAHVRKECLSGVEEPKWVLSKDQVPGRLGKWLHRCYFTLRDWRLAWLMSILIAIPLFAVIKDTFASIYLFFTSYTLPGTHVFVTLLAIPLVPLAMYNAAGAYWAIFEIAKTRELTWKLKLMVGGVVLLFNVLWFGLKLYLLPGISFPEPALDQALAVLRTTTGYRIGMAILVDVPLMSALALWTSKEWWLLSIKLWSALRWLVRFHYLESPGALQEFLLTPLLLKGGEEPRTLLQLSKEEIKALSSWATCRRDVIQSRLLPTTLLLTFLGLLANTQLANDFVASVVNHLNNLYQHSDSLPRDGLGSYVIVVGIGLAVYAVVKFLVELFTESFVADYIIEACVLAQHAGIAKNKSLMQQKEGTGEQAGKSRGFIKWLKDLFL